MSAFGGKGSKEDGMKEPLVPGKNFDCEKKGIGGVVFPADHVKVPVSAFVNPKNPDKVDTETLDPEAACVVITGTQADAHRAVKEIIAGSICLGLLVTVALAFLGGSYSLTHLVDYSSVPRYKGWCAVPYNYGKEVDIEDLLSKDRDSPFFFHERFTLDAEEDDYRAEVEVPDFTGGRHGRFLHDFRRNLTAIIDVTGGRCFVMPLDTRHVMRPSSLIDVLTQMDKGRYQVDTRIVRETMRVVWPPLENRKSLGDYISGACYNRETFWLKKTTLVSDTLEIHPTLKRRPSGFEFRIKRDSEGVEGPVALPSIEAEAKPAQEGKNLVKFTEFAGRNVVEFDIFGLDGPPAEV